MPEIQQLPRYPSLSLAANQALSEGRQNAAALNAYPFNLGPGDSIVFSCVGNFAYIGSATGTIQIAVDDLTNYMPWDVAMAWSMGPNHYFSRFGIKNPDDAVSYVTGIVYLGFGTITDHRMHILGSQTLSIEGDSNSMAEPTPVNLTNTEWTLIAPASNERKAIWLSVEPILDNDTSTYRAWWSIDNSTGAFPPGREIGMSLETAGVTKLPIVNNVYCRTNSDGAGKCRIRYWLLSKL